MPLISGVELTVTVNWVVPTLPASSVASRVIWVLPSARVVKATVRLAAAPPNTTSATGTTLILDELAMSVNWLVKLRLSLKVTGKGPLLPIRVVV